jgi:hypothetical protein
MVTYTPDTDQNIGTPNPEFHRMITIFNKLRTGKNTYEEHSIASGGSEVSTAPSLNDSGELLSKSERRDAAVRPRNSETEFRLNEYKLKELDLEAEKALKLPTEETEDYLTRHAPMD